MLQETYALGEVHGTIGKEASYSLGDNKSLNLYIANLVINGH